MNTGDVQNYVMERVLELLHKETLDTYRVRNNNVFTSLVETREIIQRYSEMKVKTFETVKALANETVELLKVDTCLVFQTYTRDLLAQEINEFLKSNVDKQASKMPDVGRILFCLDKCIEENRQTYLTSLLSSINQAIQDCSGWDDDAMLHHIGKLDSIVGSLCVQLIYEGYSKQFLFLELKYRAGKSYEEFCQTLKKLSKKETQTFEVIWRLWIKEEDSSKLATLGLVEEVDDSHISEEAKRKYSKKIAPGRNIYFYQEEVCALDRFSATRLSREKLTRIFDCLHLGAYSKKLELPDIAYVIEKRPSDWYTYRCVAGYFLDGQFAEDYELSEKLLGLLDNIYKSDAVDTAAKDRIQSAIRHLNYGDLDSEIGQRFINYWIALEFIFASPHTSENTYTRLKSYIIDILGVSYVRRNVDYLKDKLVSEGIIAEDYDLWESKETLDDVANKADLPLIWKYKLKNMKSRLFSHKDKLKEYYNNHIRNLERHIARIYNLRNVLVHEGAIKQDVENLSSNLRYYLVFTLDQMIMYFYSHAKEAGRVYQVDDFFNEYRSYRKLAEAEFSLEALLKVPVNKKLW